MTLSTLTVGQLRRALDGVPASLHDRPIYIWMPGCYIAMTPGVITSGPSSPVPLGSVLLEGNVASGDPTGETP